MSKMRTLRKNLDADAIERAKRVQAKIDRAGLVDRARHTMKRVAERLGIERYELAARLAESGVSEDMLIQ